MLLLWLTATQASKIPIICICNDKWSQKLKSLQNHCQEFAFHRPTKQQIRNRLLQIAQQEGLKARAWRSHWLLVSADNCAQANDIAMEALIESCKSDIRLVLNTLQAGARDHVAVNTP